MESFFRDYPEFYETGLQPARLGARYDVIIAGQPAAIAGKTILDLGSHEGRWAFAALKAGANRVICVEGRPELAEATERNFAKHNIPRDRYEIVIGEGLDVMREQKPKCDTVFLLGIYYHIHNHLDWVRAIRETGAQNVIIDTGLTPCEGEFDNVVRFKVEDAAMHTSSSYETFAGYGFAVGGHPSRAFVNFSFRVYGYAVSELDWKAPLVTWGVKGLEDYAEDRRATFLAKRVK